MTLDLNTLNILVQATADDPLFDEYYHSKHIGDDWGVAQGTNAPPLVAMDCEMVNKK